VITAVVPVSPIKSHPGTEILTETLDSIRACLPDTEIIVTFDGVRGEQEDRRDDYEQFLFQALWLADHHYRNILPLIFDRHEHQTGMMRHTLTHIDTELLLYVEQDTPLVTDEPIDWDSIREFIHYGHSNVVRLHHEGVIPAEHEHMMHGHDGEFIRTSQWSQRPHIASTAYYRRIMETCFTPDAKSFIEDKMHGVVDQSFRRDKLQGWLQHRIHIWDPQTGNMKRSYHTDGRAGEAKYDDTQVF